MHHLVVLIQAFDLFLWVVMALSVLYVLFFALASLLPSSLTQNSKLLTPNSSLPTPNSSLPTPNSSLPTPHFLVLFPAYREDTVIRTSVETFLKQDYPRDHYQVTVISDHETDETNAWLSQQPITLLIPQFEKSSKARALQYAVRHAQEALDHEHHAIDYVVILDADNIVAPDFLSQLQAECRKGYRAIQCHRTAKNADSDIAALDGLSEEINNSIFRRGHNRVGLSSALIGSGMCFDYQWFCANVDSLDSAVEDRELEALLMRQNIFIHYAEDILVKDEKVSSSDNFQRQRLRWMTGQVQALFRMAPYLPKAFLTGNLNYIDKTVQQALIPRSLLLVAVFFMSLLSTLSSIIFPSLYTSSQLLTPHFPFLTPNSLKWWLLLVLLAAGLLVAIPSRLRTRALASKAMALPGLVLRMTGNLFHIDRKSTEFIHTTHDK